jgi:hypothetical protein
MGTKRRIDTNGLIARNLAERGGLKPQVSRQARITREIAAISFIILGFQSARAKPREGL